MANKHFFYHDVLARNDQKIKMVRVRYGFKGYAVYFMLLEVLAETEGVKIDTSNEDLMMCIADDFRIEYQELLGFIDYFQKIGLILEDGNFIYSQRLSDHMLKIQQTLRARQEGMRKARAKKNKANNQTETPAVTNQAPEYNLSDIKVIDGTKKMEERFEIYAEYDDLNELILKKKHWSGERTFLDMFLTKKVKKSIDFDKENSKEKKAYVSLLKMIVNDFQFSSNEDFMTKAIPFKCPATFKVANFYNAFIDEIKALIEDSGADVYQGILQLQKV
jgi:hypothetical protein